MIKLIDILKELSELSLHPGHASNNSTVGIVGSNIYRLLPDQLVDKYEEFDDPKINNLGQQFVKDLIKYNKVIGQEGQYKVILNKEREEDYNFYLINTKTYLVESAIIGIIETKKEKSLAYNYNLKSAFNLTVYQVHWSNIATEYRGKGLGKVLYSEVYEYISSLGAALASDGILFDGSSGMWRTYMPTIASYFGVVMDDIIIPVTKEDVSNTSLVAKSNLDSFIAMENPPKLIRKIAYNVEGLSFANGEYGVTQLSKSIKEKFEIGPRGKVEEVDFFDLVDETDTIKSLIKDIKYELGDIHTALGTDKISNLKCLIFAFDDAIVAVKQVGDRLVAQLI